MGWRVLLEEKNKKRTSDSRVIDFASERKKQCEYEGWKE